MHTTKGEVESGLMVCSFSQNQIRNFKYKIRRTIKWLFPRTLKYSILSSYYIFWNVSFIMWKSCLHEQKIWISFCTPFQAKLFSSWYMDHFKILSFEMVRKYDSTRLVTTFKLIVLLQKLIQCRGNRRMVHCVKVKSIS